MINEDEFKKLFSEIKEGESFYYKKLIFTKKNHLGKFMGYNNKLGFFTILDNELVLPTIFGVEEV